MESIVTAMPIKEPNTIVKVAAETGVPVNQIQYAIVRGELKPESKVGRAYTLTNEQVELIKTVSGLVGLGITLYLAIKAFNHGWRPQTYANG
jgi:hypothetical protein